MTTENNIKNKEQKNVEIVIRHPKMFEKASGRHVFAAFVPNYLPDNTNFKVTIFWPSGTMDEITWLWLITQSDPVSLSDPGVDTLLKSLKEEGYNVTKIYQ